MSGSTEMTGAGCADMNVKISGMSCVQIAAKDMCDLKTTSGKKLGPDLCRKSCGVCPKTPPAAQPGSESRFPDPTPARIVAADSSEDCPSGCTAKQCRPGNP